MRKRKSVCGARGRFARAAFRVIEFPYAQRGMTGAVGTYLNYPKTETHIFLPKFGIEANSAAMQAANALSEKAVVPVGIHHIAEDGGVFNCINWRINGKSQ